MALKTQNSMLSGLLSSAQNKTYTVLVVSIITVVLMVVFAIIPAYLSITNKIVDNKAKQEYINDLDTYRADLSSLTAQQNTKDEEIRLLDTYFPNNTNSEFYLANIDAIASSYGCHIVAMTFSKSTKALGDSEIDSVGPAVRVPIGLIVIGELSGLQLFLAHIEELPSVFKINSFNYSTEGLEIYMSEEEDFTGMYSMSISAEYFYWNFSTADE